MNILAIGAHPDDIEFGCAHVLIREVRKGNRVKLLVLSKGEAGSEGSPEEREMEARNSAKLIGAELDFMDLGGDCHIEYIRENAFKLAAEIRKFQPQIVLAPHTSENQHPDHAVAGKLARDAARFARYAGLGALKRFSLSGSGPHAIGALYFYTITKQITTREIDAPEIVIDISDVQADWVKVMECHASQMRSRNYCDLRVSGARNLGLSIGVEYAAGFHLSDPIRLDALSDISMSSRHF
jgi:N-acetylglucosamine malate deacetylase 1